MKMSKFVLILSLATLLAVPKPAPGQGRADTAQRNDSRSAFRLLPGYNVKVTAGPEGGGSGTIWKEGGPSIGFEMGGYRANAIDSVAKEQLLWREEQTIEGNRFICVYTRSDELVIAVLGSHPADFRAKIRNPKELAEVLLTVLTFEPEHGYPVAPSAIVH
jgi:hypothetical protein